MFSASAALSAAPASARADLWLRKCAQWAREREPSQARACYADLARADIAADAASTAAWRAAALRFDEGEPDGAAAELWAIVERWPGEVAATRAVRMLRQVARERGGAPAEVETLMRAAGLAVAEPARDRLAECWSETARLLVESGEPARALAAAASARAAAAGTTWLDAATYWQARSWRTAGKPDAALAGYDEIRARWSSSWLFGSYQSAYYDRALYEAATLLVELGRSAEAHERFTELIDTAPQSRLAAKAKLLLGAGHD